MTTIGAIRRAPSLTFIGWITMVSVAGLLHDVVWTQPSQAVEDVQEPHQHEMTGEDHHEQGATEAMAEAHQHMGPHMKWTARRPLTSNDEVRAAEIAQTLREALAKYHDYQIAIRDGFQPFHPEVAQPHYHFTSKWRGFKAAFRFNPAEPTSLLYRKTANGYELEGAMYTAPKGMSEARLNQRVPLSVGQWHAHVDLCFPRKGSATSTDWTRFGFKGSIATKEECEAAGGKFYPQVFGWMLHVYPFEQRPERIWTH
jgi:hypothetical protein